MAGKLDRSLDDILKEKRDIARRSRNPRRVNSKASPPAPVGGVKKATKPFKPAGKAIKTRSKSAGESKIIVSNLPTDVVEQDLKDYFSQVVGPVKKVLLTYGPNGQSRGVATLTFAGPNLAAEASKKLDGIKVDNKPMKIEVIVGARDVPQPAPAKSMAERVAMPPKAAAKPQPKPATAFKANNTKNAGRRGRNKSRNIRGKPKTAEELDAEMQDYFESGINQTAGNEDTAMVTNGGAVQPSGVDTGMEDEIM